MLLDPDYTRRTTAILHFTQKKLAGPIYNYHPVNPYPAKLIYLNFQPLEVVSRHCDPQLQVVKNYP